jgi:acyl-CoA thioester hydrolase
MAREDFTAAHRVRVRWAEADMQGIVFNGHYLTYFDVAVTEYWRAVGMPYPQTTADTGGELYTVKAAVEYHAPARYDDELDLCVRCARIGRSSLTFHLEIWRADTHIASGELIYVHADPASRKSTPLPERLTGAIRRFERKAPD